MSTKFHRFRIHSLLALLVSILSFSTSAQTEKYYFDRDWIHCDEADAKYYRIIEEVDTLLKVTDYYKSGRKQFEGFVENKVKNLEVLKIRGDFEQKTVGTCMYYKKNGKRDYSFNMRPFDKASGIDSIYINQLDSLDTIGVDLSEFEFQISYYKKTIECGFILTDPYIPHGNWIEKDVSTGTLLGKSHYKEGSKDGITVIFYSDGTLKELAFYKNGELHGELRKYNRKGRLVKGDEYENGKLIETWFYQKPKKKKS